MFVWDQLFLQKWKPKVFRDFCLCLIFLLRENLLTDAKDFPSLMKVRGSFKRNSVASCLSDMLSEKWALSPTNQSAFINVSSPWIQQKSNAKVLSYKCGPWKWGKGGLSADSVAKKIYSIWDVYVVVHELNYLSCKNEGNWRYFFGTFFILALCYAICNMPLQNFTPREKHCAIIQALCTWNITDYGTQIWKQCERSSCTLF